MIPKLFSDKFLKRVEELDIALPTLLGLHKSRIVMYPFASNKFQDIRNVFNQTESENYELIGHYESYLDNATDSLSKAKIIAMQVEKRLTYKHDSQNWGKVEYWARPIEVHKRRYDDCDGYSVLITKLLRLFGLTEYEVFTAAGPVVHPSGRIEYHAYTIVFDINTFMYYPVEGSFYHEDSMNKLGSVPLYYNKKYQKPFWITNDKVSYSTWPLIRFVK